MAHDEDPARARDAALLAAYAAGDHSAARTLVSEHAPRVLALARRMLCDADEAEDVAQEAMMRLWKIAPDWRAGEARISTWLYRVAANLATDRLRRRPREAPLEAAGDPADGRPEGAARLMRSERSAALASALMDLPERQRLAVVLRHLEERSNPEIAEIMGLSVEAVESLIARGKRALTGILHKRQDEVGLKDV